MLLLNTIFTDFEYFYKFRVLLNFVFFGQTLDICENKVAGRMIIIFLWLIWPKCWFDEGSYGFNIGMDGAVWHLTVQPSLPRL